MRRRWRLASAEPDVVRRLAAELGISPLLATLLANRSITAPDTARDFLGARLSEHLRSPLLFREMPAASERVLEALRRGERIGIYGDYDVDGISGSSILIRFFRSIGAPEPLLYIPNRVRDGYGLTEPGVRRLAEQGAKVMITVDCGGVAHREIALARQLGVDTIVCDHHQVSGTPLPAHAVLNPIEPQAGFPFQGLCGAGVAFYLALGTRMRLRETGGPVPDLRRSLDLVALGTVADLVPVVEENRVLVKYGMREIAASQLPGVVALKQVSGANEISTGVIGFRLAPRLNAGGRLADATRSVELLTTDDPVRAGELAAGLDEENRARQGIEREILDQAIAMIDEAGGIGERKSIVLASDEWHPGVIGIVCSRLVERYYRPTILIATGGERGVGRGSGRSIRGLNLYECIKEASEVLEGFGGHKVAAGLSIRPERVPELAARFEAAVAARTRPDDFVPVSDVDAELPLEAIGEEALKAVEQMEPFGPANAEPVFLARDVTVRSARVVGETHLKLYLQQGSRAMPAIGFGMADLLVQEGTHIDVLYSLLTNEWNGARTTELRIRDLRPVK